MRNNICNYTRVKVWLDIYRRLIVGFKTALYIQYVIFKIITFIDNGSERK